jgi:TetR/AcrR family transcriptional repressor of nem operon
MARPREFEADKALNGAMDVFWTHGYDKASLPLLLEGMGLSRGSFYKAFGDKKSVFLCIMLLYEEKAVSTAVALLKGGDVPDGLDRIAMLFASIVTAVVEGDTRGCLLCSSAAGPASQDLDIGEATHRLLGRMLDGFRSAIDASHWAKTGDAAKRVELSQMLLTHYIGLRTQARAQVAIPHLQASSEGLMALLRRKES